jgi:GNAT superfamily N-acetyltransferase
MAVRHADPAEIAAVRGILDAAMLSVEPAQLREGTTLVAVEADRLLGVLVLDGAEIDAVAVRPRRRNQGIGSALVAAAGDRRDRLTAGFDPDVRPFYESLAFDIRCENGRCRGERDPA